MKRPLCEHSPQVCFRIFPMHFLQVQVNGAFSTNVALIRVWARGAPARALGPHPPLDRVSGAWCGPRGAGRRLALPSCPLPEGAPFSPRQTTGRAGLRSPHWGGTSSEAQAPCAWASRATALSPCEQGLKE